MDAPVEDRHRKAAREAFNVSDGDLLEMASLDKDVAADVTQAILEIAAEALAKCEAKTAISKEAECERLREVLAGAFSYMGNAAKALPDDDSWGVAARGFMETHGALLRKEAGI